MQSFNLFFFYLYNQQLVHGCYVSVQLWSYLRGRLLGTNEKLRSGSGKGVTLKTVAFASPSLGTFLQISFDCPPIFTDAEVMKANQKQLFSDTKGL